MEVKITGSPKEIAALIKNVQGQYDSTDGLSVKLKVIDRESFIEQQRENLAAGLGADLDLNDRIKYL